MPTYVSTAVERRVLIEQAPDGRERICVATRQPNTGNHTFGSPCWEVELTHPSGWTRTEKTFANGVEIVAAMGNLLEGTKQRFLDEAKGDTYALDTTMALSSGAGGYSGVSVGVPQRSGRERAPIKTR